MHNLFLRFKKNDFIAKCTVSFLCVMTVLFCIVMLITGVSYKHSVNQNEKFNHYAFQNIVTSVTETVKGIQSFHLYLQHDKGVLELCNSKNADYFSKQTTYNTLNNLKTYKQASPNIDLFFIYLKNTDMVLYDGGIVESRSFYDTYFKTPQSSYKSWKSSLLNSTHGQYHTTTLAYSSSTQSNIECVTYQFFIGSTKNVGCILSNTQNLIKNIEHANWPSSCNIFVFNPYNSLTVSQTTPSFTDRAPKKVQDMAEYENEHYTVFSETVVLDTNQWSIFALVDNDELNFSLDRLVKTIAVIIVLTIVSLILSLLYFRKTSLNPLKNLFNTIPSTNNDEENSIDALCNSLKNILSEKETLELDIKQNKKLMEKASVINLFKGHFDEYFFNHYVPTFEGSYFAVAIFNLADISVLFEDDDLTNEQRTKYLQFILNNIFSELFSTSNCNISFYEIEDNYLGLFNFNNQSDFPQISSILDSGTKIINENFDIDLVYMLSDCTEGIYNISLAYSQALKCLNHQMFFATNTSVSYSDIFKGSHDELIIFDYQSEQQLTNSIKGMDRDGALSVIDRIFQKISENDTITLERIKYIIINILFSISKAVENDEENVYNSCFLVQECTNLNALRTVAIDYINATCDAIEQNYSKVKTKLPMDEVIDWTHTHYTDPTLNISGAANHFNVSPNYFSKMFKLSFNVSFIDYINSLRIERTLELIRTEGLPVEKAATMSGFTNKRTFYRVRKNFDR